MSASTETAHTQQIISADLKSIHVLHLHSGNILGGVESVLSTMAEYSSACPQMHQSFALVFDGKFAESLRATGAVVHILPEVRLRNPISMLRAKRSLRRLLQTNNYDVVISHSTWCQAVFGSVVKQAHIPLVFWMHNDFDGHWLQKLASFNRPDFAICNSAYAQSTLQSVYPGLKSEVSFYPVRPLRKMGTRQQTRADLEVAPNEVLILMVSRMDAWKGHQNLLDALSRITEKRWVTCIAGGPQTAAERVYLETLRARVRELGIEHRIKFLGHRNDVAQLLEAADIFCQPNQQPEPFGIVFIEALQAGVSIVTVNSGGPREILNGSCGVLVSPGNPAELADALGQLVDDPVRRLRLGSQGPARARELCDPQRQITRTYELLVRTVTNAKSVKGSTA
jgi:glycosyltransferase involved in cell wall biosynthesis